MKILGSTVRLQFNKDFTFDHAAACVDYYAQLGITHYYASPIYTARAGSMHGYDVVDFAEVNPELGGEPALRAMVARLRERGMGLVVDLVPNHMAVGESDNRWWLDVLEWGESSPHAQYFDIDWNPANEAMRGKVLAPFLGKPYAQALSDGDLKLAFDEHAGIFHVTYGPHRFPITPQHYADILRAADGATLEPASQCIDELASSNNRDAAAAASRRLVDAYRLLAGRRAIGIALSRYNEGDEGRKNLDALLDRQHFRLVEWREASRSINWRRFFDVTSLAAIRADRDEVFEATHAMPLRLYGEGLIDGFRIDHIDGLADPAHYLVRLRERLDALHARRPQEFALDTPWLVVEKILSPGERLRRDWQADGATGYKFMDAVSGLLHDPDGEASLTALWQAFTGEHGNPESEAYRARKELAEGSFAAELDALTALVLDYAAAKTAAGAEPDIDAARMRPMMLEFLAHFPIYRSYVGVDEADSQDRAIYRNTLAATRMHWTSEDRTPLVVLETWIATALEELPAEPSEAEHRAHQALQRLQKLLPALDAKSVEDTVFYRYGRLLSRNEVGSWPGQFAIAPNAFHALNRERGLYLPRSLLATATHDQKRGEDVRVRLAALSELPELWRMTVERLRAMTAPLRTAGDAPSPADELMLYQTLVGSWPMGLKADDAEGLAAFGQRVAGWQEKSQREAKLRTSWTKQDEAYESASRTFLDDVLGQRDVVVELILTVMRIAPYGALNSLAQTLLRLSVPGVPDLYQGTDFWDLSLVDPDNRRQVDYPARALALESLRAPALLLEDWADSRVKQSLIVFALALRRDCATVFERGSYEPLEALGPHAGSVLAFARRDGRDVVIVIVTRLAVKVDDAMTQPRVAPERWSGTSVQMPADAPLHLDNALGGEAMLAVEGRLPLTEALAHLPVALLRYRTS